MTMSDSVTKKCPHCNGDTPKRNKFCSKVCSSTFHHAEKRKKLLRNNCKRCGKKCRRSKQEYCRLECYYASVREMEQVETEKVCKICSVVFLQWDKAKPIIPKAAVCESCRSTKRELIAKKCRKAAKVRFQNFSQKERSLYYESANTYRLQQRRQIQYYIKAVIKGAKTRGLSFEVTVSDLTIQLIRQNGICSLSGRKISLLDNSASLDRINSNVGYTKDNIQWLYKPINTMKMALPQADFLQLCREIATHHPQS